MEINQLEMVRIEFSYSCLVRVEGIKMETLRGRNVVIVEDIIDTGNTMKKLIPLIESCGVASVVVN